MIYEMKMKCSNSAHKNQNGSYFCKKCQCIQKNPICVLCALSTHKTHKPQPFKIILKKIQEDSKTYSQNLTLLAEIDLLKQKLYTLCTKIHETDHREIIKSSIDHYLSILMSKIDLDEVGKLEQQIIKSLTEDEQKQQLQKQIIRKIIKYEKKHNQCQIQNETKGGKQISNCTRLLKNIIQNLQDASTNFQQLIKKQQIDSSTIQIFSSGNSKYHFNNKLKHKNLILVGDNIVKIIDQYASTNYLALCNPKITFDKIQSITFHMVRISSYISVGICKKDKISNNYQFNSSQNNHGTYQISFDGYSWCDGNTTFNDQYAGWYFTQGDKVTIQFNPKNRKIKFWKNLDQEENYQIPIEFTKNDKLFFCVSLNSKPEEVHIVD